MGKYLKGIMMAFNPSVVVGDIKSIGVNNIFILGVFLTIMGSLSLYWGDTLISTVSGLTGVLCVFMVTMRRLSNFFWGFINVLLYGYVAYSYGIYGDAALNWLFYLPSQFIGAYMWSTSLSDDGVVESKKLSVRQYLVYTMASVMFFVIVAIGLIISDGSQPYLDSFTTVASIVATLLMVYSYREQWLVWISVNVVSIAIWSINISQTGEGVGVLIMWCMFLANSVYGAVNWYKKQPMV